METNKEIKVERIQGFIVMPLWSGAYIMVHPDPEVFGSYTEMAQDVLDEVRGALKLIEGAKPEDGIGIRVQIDRVKNVDIDTIRLVEEVRAAAQRENDREGEV